MSGFKNLFALADCDNAVTLLSELGDVPTHRVRSEAAKHCSCTRSTAAKRTALKRYANAAVSRCRRQQQTATFRASKS